MSSSPLLHTLSVILITGALGACGGSSSSSGSSGSVSAETLLFHTSDDGSPVSLYAVDPADPDNPVEVADNLADNPDIAPLAVRDGSYGAEIRNARQARVVYNSTDGHLYQVDTGVGSDPQPRRFSGETAADALCDLQVEPDYRNLDRSLVLYALDVGGECHWYFSFLGDDEQFSPFMLPESPISVIRDPDTGALREVLVVDSNDSSLKAFDLDDLRWKRLKEGISSARTVAVSRTRGTTLVFVTTTDSADGLHAYDGPDGELEPVGLPPTATYVYSQQAIGTGDFFLFTGGVTGELLFRIDMGEEAPSAKEIASSSTGYAGSIEAVGKDRVLWKHSYYTGTYFTQALDSYPLEGGSPTSLVAKWTLDTDAIASPSAPEGNIFYKYTEYCSSTQCPAASTVDTIDIRGSGYGSESFTAVDWLGNTWSNTIPDAGKRAQHVFYHDGDHIMSRDAGDPRPATEIALGDLPENWDGGAVRSFAPHALLEMERDTDDGQDLWLVDPESEFSLERITDDDSTSRPVPGF